MSIKISSLEIENVKRVKAVALTPAENGLTIIGGNNGQGKTSVLDAIAWALGGDKYRPSGAYREGSTLPPELHVRLSNGIVVERKGKNSALKVTDPSGHTAGQTLLNSFIEAFALDLPRFMQQTSREKADTLLRIIGVGDKLYQLDNAEQRTYNERHAVGQIADQKRKYAREMTVWEGVPKEPVSALELIHQQQEILARNGENQRKREQLNQMLRDDAALERRIIEQRKALEELETKRNHLQYDITTARKTVAELQDESTAELERNIADVDALNVKIRANLDRERVEDEARQYEAQYNSLSADLEKIRNERRALLDNAALPLPGLSVENGELVYNGQKWDCMSGSDQLRVSVAIVRKLNPDCGFVLMDKLEQMDSRTLAEFGAWLESEGLQAICTRVSTGDECSIIIEDGAVVNSSTDKSNTSTELTGGDYWS